MVSSTAITAEGLKNILHRGYESAPTLNEPSQFKLGASDTTATINDTDLAKPIPISGSTTIDACDAVTGWVNSSDGDTEVLNTTAGEFKEGTGCLNLPTTFNTGTAIWSKTIGSINLSANNEYIYLWYYIADITDLTTASDAVRIVLGTGGYTNVNNYDTANTAVSNGWNLLVFDVDDSTSTGGSGLDETDVDSIRLEVKLGSSQVTNDMRMDFWHYCTETQQLISFLGGFPSFDDLNIEVTTKGFVSESQGNGYNVLEVGLFNGDSTPKLVWRDTLSSVINKTSNVRITIEGVDEVD